MNSPIERGLCAEAVRLARTLRQLMPDEPQVAGMCSLLLLTEARRGTRFAAEGSLVLLAEQDRSRWDRAAVDEGLEIVRWCLTRKPGPFQLQVAISAVHADAASGEETDWWQILALYDQLLEMAPTPVVALNRAVAVSEVHGPAAALALRRPVRPGQLLPVSRTRADLPRLRLQREVEAAYARAVGLASTYAERHFLSRGGRGARS